MIWTSYFGGLRSLPATILPVAICHRPPYWFRGPNISALAPSGALLEAYKSRRCGWSEYADRYQQETLDPLDPQQIYRQLTGLEKPDLALMCFEHPRECCHRFLTSHWLNQNLGLHIVEYGNHPIIFGG